MKTVKSALIVASMLVSVSAFAQAASSSNTGNVQTATGEPTNVQSVYSAQPQVQEKTRTQVYQELVQAEKDGSLKQLNDTIYKGN